MFLNFTIQTLNSSSTPHQNPDRVCSETTAAACAESSTTHLVLMPCYNPGAQVISTVRRIRQEWSPVWVVVDGSTDGSTALLQAQAAQNPGLKVLVQPRNSGKGSAVLRGVQEALQHGFTHALTIDADGQHPAQRIPTFMACSIAQPDALILGKPVFDASAPALRVNGRKISNAWANIETLGAGIGDSLYGFRVYPLRPLHTVMQESRWMRRFDFDPEAAVRLCWAGLKPVNLDAPVKYLPASEGGVSHFNYLRDNVLLTWMHTRLLLGFLRRLPQLIVARSKRP
jgi:glycosyltransferase involved in cell wall biosynthesis